jgi:hypothetical protein
MATGYARLASLGSIQTFEPQSTVSHGYRDVRTSMHGSAWEGGLTLYKFNGRQYRRVQCFAYTWRYLDSAGVSHDQKRQRNTPEPCGPKN